MPGFEGFQRHPERSVMVPDLFFTRLLPDITSLVELKVTLHLMWSLSQRAGKPRCISYKDLASDEQLLGSLRTEVGPRPAEDFLREGLELAVTRGSVLSVGVIRPHATENWYFLNTAASRDAIEHLQTDSNGTALEAFGPERVEAVHVYRPNVFALYEQNIGPLTPVIADRLRLAESSYPAMWLEDAIRMAVEYNKRNWRYVEAILQRWKAEGKDEGLRDVASSEEADPYGYFRSKYQHLYR